MATTILQAAQEDERRKAAALGQPRPNSFGDAAASAANPGVTQVGAAPAGQTYPANTPLGKMHSAGSRTGGQMLADGLTSGARSFFDSFQKAPEPAAVPSAPDIKTAAQNPTDIRLSAGTQTAPMSLSAAAADDPATPDARQVMPGVYRSGNSYSDSAQGAIDGAASRGLPTAQNLEAAEALAQRSQQESMARVTAQPAVGFQPAGVTAPTVRHSGNDWQSRNDLRNAMVSATSIMNDGGKWDKHGKGVVSPERAYAAQLAGADAQLRGAQPGVDVAAMRENAGIQRTGMQETGANQRSLAQRLLEQQKINQAGEAQGIANRGASLIQGMREQVAAEQDPAKRKSLVQRLREAQGQTDQADPYLVVPGGQQVDENGRPYNMPSSVFNRQTQQFVQQPRQAGLAAPQAGTVQGGYRFKGGDPSSPASWEKA